MWSPGAVQGPGLLAVLVSCVSSLALASYSLPHLVSELTKFKSVGEVSS